MRLTAAFFVAVLAAGCATARGRPVTAPGELAYRLTHPATPHDVDVEVRRVREGPAAFAFTSPGAVDLVRIELKGGAQVDVGVPASGVVDLPNDWAVVRYRYALDDVMRSFGMTDLGWGVAGGDDVVLPGAAFLLRPRVPHDGLTAAITDQTALPSSLPWEGARGWLQPGFYAHGGRRCTFQVGRGQLVAALLGPPHPLGDEAICRWLRASAAEVLTVRRDFPAPRVAIAVVPVLSNEASPFGRVLASEPRSAAFLIGTEATAPDFEKDWVVVRELLRLAIPTFEPRAPWLSEGLVTYLTEVARARLGRQTPQHAWEELLDVLDRGAGEAEGMRMEEVIRDSGGAARLRAVAAVGTLFVMALDAHLRAVTAGKRSIDDVLEAIATPVTVAQFGAQVDAVAGRPIFEVLVGVHRTHPALFPRDAVLEALRLERREGGVAFTGPSPERDAMMRVKAAQ